MKYWLEKKQIKMARQIVLNLGFLFAGSVLSALAANSILIPYGFLSGGFVGISLGIHYLFPLAPVAAIYFLLNVPVFAIGWKYVGKRFFLYSIAGMIIFSLTLKWVNLSIPIEDKILAALLAGVLTGVGSGVILRSLGSSGGLDILSVILYQRFSIRLGTTSLAFNVFVLGAGALLFSVDQALYTLIYIYVSASLMNVVVNGLSQRKAVFIISPQSKNMAELIFERINRGVTFIKGRGGYTGRDEEILYTVISFQELSRLKEIIRETDPNAFMVVTDTLEVMGHRIGNQPHW